MNTKYRRSERVERVALLICFSMKLRIRSVNGGDTHRVNLSANNTNLQSLKEAVAHKLNSSDTEIYLSLNKRDSLEGPSEEPLQSFGITAGDLVFYTLNPHSFRNNIIPVTAENLETSKKPRGNELNKNPKDENPNNANAKAQTLRELCFSAAMKRASGDSGSNFYQPAEIAASPIMKMASTDSGSDSQQPAEIGVDTEKEQGSADPMEVDDGSLGKSRSIPFFLERVLLEERENAKGGHAFLIIVVHAVMLELGFVGLNVKTSESCLGFRLPQGWAKKPLVSLCYTLHELLVNKDDVKQVENVELKFSLIGKFLVVYGGLASAKGSLHCRLSLEVGKYLPSIELTSQLIGNPDVGETLERKPEIGDDQDSLCYERVLFELWKVLKDGLCMRVYTALCEKAGLPLPPSLIMLPTELKRLIFEGLPAVDIARMGCVCTEFRFHASNDELWKQKYLAEFGPLRTQGVQRWKDAFARIWMERRRANQRRRIAEGPIWQPPPGPLLRRFPFPYGTPWGYGINGGDIDRFPAIGGGSLFRGGGIGGRLGLGLGGGGSLGGLPFRRSVMSDCNLNGFDGDIDAQADPDL